VADPPAYALHYWNGDGLVTHFDDAGEHPVLARFDARMTGLVDQLRDERAGR
jgi:3',5'-cyclic-AMP phosphodiesterase